MKATAPALSVDKHDAHAWEQLAVLGALLGVVIVLYWSTVGALCSLWVDTERQSYIHGFLIVALSAWLLISRRDEIAVAVAAPDWNGSAALIMASLLWLVAWQSSIQTAHELLLPVVIWCAFLAARGWRIARIAALPCAFLLFAVPIWDSLTPALQALTVSVVGRMLQLTGIPLHIEGDTVQLSVGTFEIEGGCAGVHFLLVALAVAVLYGEIQRDRLRARLSLIALSLCIGVLANWVRVYIIIVAGYLTNMQHYLVRVDHYRFGWVLFCVFMAGFFAIARLIPAATPVPRNEKAEPASRTVAGNTVRSRRALAMALLCLSVGPVWAAVAERMPHLKLDPGLLRPGQGGWIGPQPEVWGWQPLFPGADAKGIGVYSRGGDSIEVYRVAYVTQRQGKKLIGYGNSVLWSSDSRSSATETRGVVADEAMNELELEDPAGKHWLVLQTYQVGSRVSPSSLRTQLQYGLASLYAPEVARLLALRLPCGPDCARTRSVADDFIRRNPWVFSP